MPSPQDFTASSSDRSIAYAIDFAFASAPVLLLCLLAEAFGFSFDIGTWFTALLFCYQLVFLKGAGAATPGMRVRNICVVSRTGDAPSTAQATARAASSAFPYACLSTGSMEINVVAHGLLAAIPTLGVAYLFAELLLLEYTKDRRTISDRLTQTLVVKVPPVQPHPAPAAPMYSATDSEFGHPLRRPQ
jgi:uncharacterized RDD family membrane protein YckC